MPSDDRSHGKCQRIIDSLDERLLGLHTRLGGYWQEKTQKGMDVLAGALYGISSAAFLINSLNGNIYSVPLCIWTGMKYNYHPKINDMEQGDLGYEVQRISTKGNHVNDVVIYGAGIVSALGALYLSSYDIMAGGTANIVHDAGHLCLGLGIILWKTADYLMRSYDGKPPKKTERRAVLENARGEFLGIIPQLNPEPVPVELCSGINPGPANPSYH